MYKSNKPNLVTKSSVGLKKTTQTYFLGIDVAAPNNNSNSFTTSTRRNLKNTTFALYFDNDIEK